jgi:DNA polymerase III subunit epsilon
MAEGLNFVAVDVETANSSYPESICQIGLAVVRDGIVVENLVRSVKTDFPFGWWQSRHLSIKEEELKYAPTFLDVAHEIRDFMSGPVFSHTSYDKFAIGRACSVCGYDFEDVIWLDSSQVVRRAWPERYAKTGYGLKNVAADLGIEFSHHDAGEDARAVAEIIIRASTERAIDIAGWTERVRKPISNDSSKKPDLRRDGNVDGPLYGEVVVLTGGFDLPKAEQAELAAYAGCEVAANVTKKATLVVVGNDRFAGGERSGKWKRAEELVAQGYPIRVLSETDFRALISDE